MMTALAAAWGTIQPQPQWHYTNDEHTEARRGRWLVRLGYRRDGIESSTIMTHDECGLAISADPETQEVTTAYMQGQAREVFASFVEWHAADTQPAVPKVGDYIRATLRFGGVDEFEVTRVAENPDHKGWWAIEGGEQIRVLHIPDTTCHVPGDILSWVYADRPRPAEPVKEAHAIATVSVHLDLTGLADDLQAAADAVRARLEEGLKP